MDTEGLSEWWAKVSSSDAVPAIEKAEEYGSMDLAIIGSTLRRVFGAPASEVTDEEIGIAFYTLGKVARVLSSIAEGKRPSDDTWHDLTVYPMMVRRIRDAGQWP